MARSQRGSETTFARVIMAMLPAFGRGAAACLVNFRDTDRRPCAAMRRFVGFDSGLPTLMYFRAVGFVGFVSGSLRHINFRTSNYVREHGEA